MTLAIDHVLIAVRDLAAAAARLLDEHGLASVPGGRHAAFGTANRIVPLGDAYLELIAIDDEAVAMGNPLGQAIAARLAGGDAPFGWCVRTDDIEREAARLPSFVVPGSRTLPDGGKVTWRLAGLERSLAEPWLPFFIEWDAGTPHPGAHDAPHRIRPVAIEAVEVAGDADRLRTWLDEAALPVRIRGDRSGVVAVVVANERGSVEIR